MQLPFGRVTCQLSPKATNKAVSSARERNRHLVTERAAIRPRRAFGSGDVSLPRARTNDVGVLFATISRDSPTVLSQQPRGLTLAIEYLRGDSTRDRSQMRMCCVPHETIGVCMTLSVCGLGVRNAPSPVVCHAHCPAGAVSVQGKNQTNPYSYITVERRSERTVGKFVYGLRYVTGCYNVLRTVTGAFPRRQLSSPARRRTAALSS